MRLTEVLSTPHLPLEQAMLLFTAMTCAVLGSIGLGLGAPEAVDQSLGVVVSPLFGGT